MAHFGNPSSAKPNFNRYIALGKPKDPETLDELDIQGSWADDSDSNRFLIDNNNNNDNRIIVFGTDHCLGIWMGH